MGAVKETGALLWVAGVFLIMVLPLGLAGGQDVCSAHQNKDHRSPLLESMKCHNDYQSKIICHWNSPNTSFFSTLSLHHWSSYQDSCDFNESLCRPYRETWTSSGQRTVYCEYKTLKLGASFNHTFFFKPPGGHAPFPVSNAKPPGGHAPPTGIHAPPPGGRAPFPVSNAMPPGGDAPPPDVPLDLHVRALAPTELSKQDEAGGGQTLRWVNPYPPSSSMASSISYQLAYRTQQQLAYRTQQQQDWTTEEVSDTQLRLWLQPGRRYEARVRARVAGTVWSGWSPLVVWQNTEGPWGLGCVMGTDSVVKCSWRLSKDLAQTSIYRLSCRHKNSSQVSECCVNSTVQDEPEESQLLFSCVSLLSASALQHIHLELLPSYNTKEFQSRTTICLDPPEGVRVEEDGSNWLLRWQGSPSASVVTPSYQVRYYPDKAQHEVKVFNVSPGSLSATILSRHLVPSSTYVAQVRVQVLPVDNFYQGPPSEWSAIATWTSKPDTLSQVLVYSCVAVSVVTVFIFCLLSVPSCYKRMVLWEGSLPSPVKSKVLSDMVVKNVKETRGRVVSLTAESLDLCLFSNCYMSDLLTQDSLLFHHNAPPMLVVQMPECTAHSFSGPYIFFSSTSPECPVSVDSCKIANCLSTSTSTKPCLSTSTSTTPCLSTSTTPCLFTPHSHGGESGYVVLPQPRLSCSLEGLDETHQCSGLPKPTQPSEAAPPYTPMSPSLPPTCPFLTSAYLHPQDAVGGGNWASLLSPGPPTGGAACLTEEQHNSV